MFMLKSPSEKSFADKLMNFRHGLIRKVPTSTAAGLYIRYRTEFKSPTMNENATAGKTNMLAIIPPNEILAKNCAEKKAMPSVPAAVAETDLIT